MTAGALPDHTGEVTGAALQQRHVIATSRLPGMRRVITRHGWYRGITVRFDVNRESKPADRSQRRTRCARSAP